MFGKVSVPAVDHVPAVHALFDQVIEFKPDDKAETAGDDQKHDRQIKQRITGKCRKAFTADAVKPGIGKCRNRQEQGIEQTCSPSVNLRHPDAQKNESDAFKDNGVQNDLADICRHVCQVALAGRCRKQLLLGLGHASVSLHDDGDDRHRSKTSHLHQEDQNDLSEQIVLLSGGYRGKAGDADSADCRKQIVQIRSRNAVIRKRQRKQNRPGENHDQKCDQQKLLGTV